MGNSFRSDIRNHGIAPVNNAYLEPVETIICYPAYEDISITAEGVGQEEGSGSTGHIYDLVKQILTAGIPYIP